VVFGTLFPSVVYILYQYVTVGYGLLPRVQGRNDNGTAELGKRIGATGGAISIHASAVPAKQNAWRGAMAIVTQPQPRRLLEAVIQTAIIYLAAGLALPAPPAASFSQLLGGSRRKKAGRMPASLRNVLGGVIR
jgi:hypothetical protein